jgi:hypothetical protein
MSDQYDPDLLEAARAIAVRAGALGACHCGQTWTTNQYSHENEGSMANLVAAARKVIAEDEDLDRFEDDGGLRHVLSSVLFDAAPEKNCDH